MKTPFALLLFLPLFAINRETDHFNVPVATVKGDLNKDKIPDLVIVTQDTLQDTRPYKLEVFFLDKAGKKTRIVSTTKALEPEYPNGRAHKYYGQGIGDPTIEKGVLWLNYGMIRGHIEYKFRYQKSNFEMIGYTYCESDGQGTITTIDFNLSTGVRIYELTDYHNDSVTVHKTEKKIIHPLPKLQEFEMFKDNF